MTDAFVADVRRSLRASLFRKLRPFGLGQDEVTRLVAAATTRAIALANVRELASAAGLATPVVEALRSAQPYNPTLAAYDTARDSLPSPVRSLMIQQNEV